MARRALLLATALVALAPAARADARAECEKAFSQAPELARRGQLRAARAELVRCSGALCPSSMAQLCTDDLRQLETRVPSVVFAAQDASGADVLDARVSEDGRVLAEALDGRAIELDPGPHRFRFERPGAEPAEVTVVVREGEKLRTVRATLGEASAPPPAPPPAAPERRPVPWTVFAAG